MLDYIRMNQKSVPHAEEHTSNVEELLQLFLQSIKDTNVETVELGSDLFKMKDRNLQSDSQASRDDEVNHPSHYTAGKYEVFDVLQDWFAYDPLGWQVGKYLARYRHKGNSLQDLKKARWYLERLILAVESTQQRMEKMKCQPS